MDTDSKDLRLPGEIIYDLKVNRGVVVLGPGLRRNGDQDSAIVTRAGELHFRPPNVYWINTFQKRYFPKKGDLVVGVVTAKRGDIYKVDIGGSELASLSTYAFEGATKKQKTELQVGEVVYARLLSANKEMEPDLICVDSYFKAGRLGALPADGVLVTVSQECAQNLLDYEKSILRQMGKKYIYEIAVGLNGKIWVNASNINALHDIFLELKKADFVFQ